MCLETEHFYSEQKPHLLFIKVYSTTKLVGNGIQDVSRQCLLLHPYVNGMSDGETL